MGKASVLQGLRLDAHTVPDRAPPDLEDPAQLPAAEQGAGVCTGVSSWTCHGEEALEPKTPPPSLPHLLPGSLLGAGKGDRAGGGWVRRLCLCKSACWCIYGPLCILCDCRAQLSMAPLCLGLSLHICSMSPPAITQLGGLDVCVPQAAPRLRLVRAVQSLGHTSAGWP